MSISKVHANQRFGNIRIPRKQITLFCQRWNVAELSLFGSILREDFTPQSDVDVLVDFKPGVVYGLFDLVKMENELRELFGRRVDLVEKQAIENTSNYLRKKNILGNTKVIYATQ